MEEIIVRRVKHLIQDLALSDLVGVLVYGSYVGGRTNSLSDLDVLIITHNYETQDSGSLMIDGIRVEYFIQDLRKLYELIEKEIRNNDPSHLTKFATCEILYDVEGKTRALVNHAKKLYETEIIPVFDDYTRYSIVSINNRIEDLESLINQESFYAVYYYILEKIRNLYGKINGIIDLPIMKIERIYTDEAFAKKYIASEVHHLPGQEFITLYLQCLPVRDKNDMLANIKLLYEYSFGHLDFDAKEFHLRFSENSPFKV